MSTSANDGGLDLLGPVRPAARTGDAPSWLVAVIAAAAVVIAGTGTAVAVGMSGGGAQPEDVLPADAVGMVKVDFDPGAQQKLALYRLGRKFPALRSKLTGKDNLRDDALRAVFSSADGLSYDKDIKPWIGDRAGVAVLPSGATDPDFVIAVQYTDHDKAEAGLKKAARAAGPNDPVAYAFVDGERYVLVGAKSSVVDKAAKADRHLADERVFSSAVDKLDGDQLLLAWGDAARVWGVIPENARKQFTAVGDREALQPSGQLVLGLHAEKDALELAGHGVGLHAGGSTTAKLTPTSGLIDKLPPGSIAALDIGGAGDDIATGYENLRKTLSASAPEALSALDGTGLSLPQDLKTLLGSELAVTVFGSKDEPHFAMRTRTSDPAAAETIANRLVGLVGGADQPAPPGLVARTSDGIVLGSDAASVTATAADGHLGDDKRFRAVLPSTDGAAAVLFVDLAKAIGFAGLTGSIRDNTAPLDAAGFVVKGGSDPRFSLRLTFR